MCKEKDVFCFLCEGERETLKNACAKNLIWAEQNKKNRGGGGGVLLWREDLATLFSC